MNRSILLLFFCIGLCAHDDALDALFPLPNYKKAIDTSMRVYSDLLILEEKAQRHERFEELVDIIVGRLVRMQSYIRQLIADYHVQKTVSRDELEYLAQLLEYMEITAEPLIHEQFPTLFNAWIMRLKDELKKALLTT